MSVLNFHSSLAQGNEVATCNCLVTVQKCTARHNSSIRDRAMSWFWTFLVLQPSTAALQELSMRLQCERWRHLQWRFLNCKLEDAMAAATPKVQSASRYFAHTSFAAGDCFGLCSLLRWNHVLLSGTLLLFCISASQESASQVSASQASASQVSARQESASQVSASPEPG